MIESTISSPGLDALGPKLDATRLIASVALRVKMISSLRSALMKLCDRLARALVGLGRLIGEIMQAAMHVGVFRRIGLLQPVEHLRRLLRRGGVVEIDQRLAIDLHRQRREIGADLVDIVAAVLDRRMRHVFRAPPAMQRGRHQRIAEAFMRDLLDRLADEGLDQQGLGLFVVDAARHQIKLQARIERAGGGAMAADHVVGEDFQFRLVVGFGLVRQQQRPRHHLASRSSARAASPRSCPGRRCGPDRRAPT